MSTFEMSHLDLEQGGGGDHCPAYDGSEGGSICLSEVEDGSCYSVFYSTAAGSYDGDYQADWVSDSENGRASVCDSRRVSSSSSYLVEGALETKIQMARVERDCRICQLSLESTNHESGIPMELGCSCKDDLAAAHKQCAETWFKIRGNKTCEICNSVAQNVVGVGEIDTSQLPTQQQQSSGEISGDNTTSSVPVQPQSESGSFWHGHRLLNFLLACMVFAFVISWLFHFNVPS